MFSLFFFFFSHLFIFIFFDYIWGTIINKQRGAVEACLAHNQEDTGSKPVVANRALLRKGLHPKKSLFFCYIFLFQNILFFFQFFFLPFSIFLSGLFQFFFLDFFNFSFWIFSLFFYKEREKTLQKQMLLRRSRNLPRGRAPLSAQKLKHLFFDPPHHSFRISFWLSFWIFSLFFYKEREKTLQKQIKLKPIPYLRGGSGGHFPRKLKYFFLDKEKQFPKPKTKPIKPLPKLSKPKTQNPKPKTQKPKSQHFVFLSKNPKNPKKKSCLPPLLLSPQLLSFPQVLKRRSPR